MCHNRSKLGLNRAGTKDTLLFWPKQFKPLSRLPLHGVTQKSRVVLPPHAPQRMQFWAISGSNERHFTLKAEPAFHPYLSSNCNGFNQTSHVHSIHIRKTGCNFGRNRTLKKDTLIFTPKNFSVSFSPHISREWLKHHTSHPRPLPHNQCNFGRNRTVTKGNILLKPKQFFTLSRIPLKRANKISRTATPHLALQPVQDWSKSGSKEGHLTIRDKTVFYPYIASHNNGVTQASHVALTPKAPPTLQVYSDRSVRKSTLLLMTIHFSAPTLALDAAGWLKITCGTPDAWTTIRASLNEIGRKRRAPCSSSANSFSSLSHLILQVGDSNISRGNLHMLCNQRKLCRNWAVRDVSLVLRPKQFFVHISLRTASDDSNMTRGTPPPCAKTSAKCLNIEHEQSALYSLSRKSFLSQSRPPLQLS
jgi:hypothetical protein